jgi:hypothetical protein
MFKPGLLHKEEENKKKGMRTSFTIHVILLLLILWPLLRKDTEQDINKQYAIQITFDQSGASNSFKGTASEGAQRPRHQTAEQVGGSSVREIPTETRTPPPVREPEVRQPNTRTPSTTVESDIYDQNTDVFASSDAELETVDIPRSQTNTRQQRTEVVVKTTTQDKVEDVPASSKSGTSGTGSGTGSGSASGSGTGSATGSTRDGSGTGQSNQGTGTGKDASGSDASSGKGTAGPGTGVFDGSGQGIFGRQPVRRPPLSDLKVNQSGRIVMKICIDRQGRSTFVDVIAAGTTIRDKAALKNALDYVGKFLWEEDYSVPREQCGKYTLIINPR